MKVYILLQETCFDYERETIVIGTFANMEKAEEYFNENINKELNGDTNTNTFEII